MLCVGFGLKPGLSRRSFQVVTGTPAPQALLAIHGPLRTRFINYLTRGRRTRGLAARRQVVFRPGTEARVGSDGAGAEPDESP